MGGAIETSVLNGDDSRHKLGVVFDLDEVAQHLLLTTSHEVFDYLDLLLLLHVQLSSYLLLDHVINRPHFPDPYFVTFLLRGIWDRVLVLSDP